MNAIGFVFCILIILSFGAFATFQKQIGSHRLRTTWLGHFAANRQILDQLTSEFYASLKQSANDQEKQKEHLQLKKEPRPTPPPSPLNASCARLNVFPLIDQNIEDKKPVYEMAANILKILYGDALFEKKPKYEYKFLDAFLKAIRDQVIKNQFTILEKVSFNDSNLQMLYYKMLKGTRQNGYPSLLDYMTCERGPSKICLFHAHPNLLSAFFTRRGANKLYAALHAPDEPAVTKETIERICQEVNHPFPAAFDLLEITQKTHGKSPKGTFIGEDAESQVSLRKEILIFQ